ncbi:MAG TPA: LptF/LptG family permease [Candidatus Krumholzibacteria bacterium]|mgnify:CR=1 FL=1|nr:LptF/LptG family permease [Candidatus Krumholzibacteria bacterium]HRX50364.1 LptF/LptG family permease [Candidatus Krumholzibacteria bacterium]
MKLTDRLILRQFLRILGFTLLGALILFSLIHLFDHINGFMDNGASLALIGRYYLNKAPETIDIVLPIGMLMASLFTVGSMARYNELAALFASGRSLLQVTRPLIVAAVLTALFSLAWSEWVLPRANANVERIWEVEVHGNPDRLKPTNNIAVNGTDGRLYHARAWVPESNRVKGFRVLGAEGSAVRERWDANLAVWDGERWILEDGTYRSFGPDGETVEPFRTLESDLAGVTPHALNQANVRPDEMTVRQLAEYVDLLRRSGSDATPYQVDFQFKLAFPMVHIIVVLLGIMLASGPRKTTVASGFGWTILISFGYYLAINFGRAFGKTGTLPPLAAAWIGNVIFGLASLILYLRIRR